VSRTSLLKYLNKASDTLVRTGSFENGPSDKNGVNQVDVPIKPDKGTGGWRGGSCGDGACIKVFGVVKVPFSLVFGVLYVVLVVLLVDIAVDGPAGGRDFPGAFFSIFRLSVRPITSVAVADRSALISSLDPRLDSGTC